MVKTPCQTRLGNEKAATLTAAALFSDKGIFTLS